MMERILRIVMGLGALALVGIVVALAVVGTRGHKRAGTASGPRYQVTVQAKTGPAPVSGPAARTPTAGTMAGTPTAGAVVRTAAGGRAGACTTGKSCRPAVLALINRRRVQRGQAALRYDVRQSDGMGACVGSQGHARAMARTRQIWHHDVRYRTEAYPHDICVPAAHETEVEAMSAGSWKDLRAGIKRLFRHPKTARRLLDGRYTRAGIGIVRHGGRYYVTIDLLG